MFKINSFVAGGLTLASLSLFLIGSASAQLRAGFDANTLPRNDDGSTGLVPIGFNADFFGTTYSNLYVNNNGNVTFTTPLSTFTPFGLTQAGRPPIIAPFFADVDTRGLASEETKYGTGTVNGHSAFGATWDGVGVGYFSGHTDLLNKFQVVLIERPDTGVGNFDIELRYEQIQWETGDASGGIGGFGGFPARAGYSNGTGNAGTFFELPGSGVSGAFLDSNPNGLSHTSLNSGTPGCYVFFARNGQVIGDVPEPGVVVSFTAMFGALGIAIVRRKRA